MERNSCSVSSCRISRKMAQKQTPVIIFHSFPLDEPVCSEWAQFCQRGAEWKPNKNSRICSNHFAPESYQMHFTPVQELPIHLRKLRADAVPTIKNGVNSKQTQEASVGESNRMDSVVLKFRNQFCRTCLKPCQDHYAIAIESKIQNMTLLDMLIQLTSFETEENNALPSVICLKCKICLVQAFNIRQEFIEKAELLIQLVAENRVVEYFHSAKTKPKASMEPIAPKRFIFADTNETGGYPSTESPAPIQSSASKNLITKPIKIKAPKQFIFTDINQAYRNLSANHQVSSDNPTLKCSAGTMGENNTKTNKNDVEQHELDISNPNDHACYTKGANGNENPVQNNNGKQQICLAESNKEREDSSNCSDSKEIPADENREQRDAWHKFMVEYEKEKFMKRKLKAEQRRALKAQQDTKVIKKTNRLHRLPHKCDKCYQRFSTTVKLNVHLGNVHAFLGTGLTCEYCGKQYFNRTIFRRHVINHRNELSGQHKCPICDRTYTDKGSLKRHEVTHTGEKKFKCKYCDNSYGRLYDLLIHQGAHTGETPHKCVECGRAFSYKTALLKHVCKPGQVKHQKYRSRLKLKLLPSKDGRCPYPGCDYTANTYCAMYAHRRTKHEPLYHCEVCKKPFAFATQLDEHSRLHTGEKPYQCNVCGRSFRTSIIHRNHLQTHSTDCSFACEICQKSFKLMASLRQHMLTHSSERKYSCEICANSYKTKGELTKHIQRKHGGENNERRKEDENMQQNCDENQL